jgi:hypothetical protein
MAGTKLGNHKKVVEASNCNPSFLTGFEQRGELPINRVTLFG